MRKPILLVSAAGLAAGLSFAAPAQAADNLDEWKLIGLTPEIVASANGGSGVIVGVYDGKTDCRHTDLTGRCEAVAITGGRYRRLDPHGTHTAGIVGGKKYGVAPSAKIINYGVFDDRGYVAGGSKLLNAWYNGKSRGASIASMSFGCAGLALCFTADEIRAMADPKLTMLFVKAAGNDGVAVKSETVAVTQAQASAALARTILVGSVDVSGKISSFSNRPGDTCLMYSGATSCASNLQWKYHFLLAPGSSIYATLPNNGYGYMSGTSMATPVVAGVAALMQARWPSLKSAPEKVAQILFTTATDMGAAGVDPVYGWGLINVTKAFQGVGTVSMVSPTGTSTPVSGTSLRTTGTMASLAAALGQVTVYDSYGRDFALAESGAVQLRRDFDAAAHLGARRLIGLGSQRDWSRAFFAERRAPGGFAMFGSTAEPGANVFTPDRSLRMGIDMPFKGGIAQLRMTGASATRLDLAFDPTLRPLSFFASSNLFKSSMLAHALVDVSSRGRLSLYGTASTGSVSGIDPSQPAFLRQLESGSTTKLALSGERTDVHQHGVGVGYWLQPDRNTVIGFNASLLKQDGAYYDFVSDLPGFERQSRMLNLGAAASRTFGSWEVSLAGEVTRLGALASSGPVRLSPVTVASGEARLRKAGLAFGAGAVADSLSVALVMPPRAVSGTLNVDFLTRTDDGLGTRAAGYRAPLSQFGVEPLKVEAAYQLGRAGSWSFDVSGGVNLHRSSYSGVGEALTSLRLSF